MTCFNPLTAYPVESGIRFERPSGHSGAKIQLPCGQCIGCRIDKGQQWAVRNMHEAQMHEESQFLTLTYNNENLPTHGSLVKDHVQKFLKRYRFQIAPQKIRYFGCGEYGLNGGRPHYHILLYGHRFSDLELIGEKVLWEPNGKRFEMMRNNMALFGIDPTQKIRLYGSELLTRLWGMGHCSIGDVNWQTANYVSQYVTKKLTGPEAEEAYRYIDPWTGETTPIEPEYGFMSRNPGIGKQWLDRFMGDVFPDDCVRTRRGTKYPAPRYYREKHKAVNPEQADALKKARKKKAEENADNTPERLAVRKECAEARLKRKTRTL